MKRLVDHPAFNIVIFALLLSLPWEFGQMWLYGGALHLSHLQGIRICTAATVGDAVITYLPPSEWSKILVILDPEGVWKMGRRHKPEEIIGKLREAEIVLAQGGTTADACRRIAVAEQTC